MSADKHPFDSDVPQIEYGPNIVSCFQRQLCVNQSVGLTRGSESIASQLLGARIADLPCICTFKSRPYGHTEDPHPPLPRRAPPMPFAKRSP